MTSLRMDPWWESENFILFFVVHVLPNSQHECFMEIDLMKVAIMYNDNFFTKFDDEKF